MGAVKIQQSLVTIAVRGPLPRFKTSQTVVVWTAIVAVVCLARNLAACAEQPPRASKSIEEFSVGKEGRLLLLPVDVGQRKLPFLLDTGASVSAFDISLRVELTTPTGTVTLETPSGLRRVEAFPWPDVKLEGRVLRSDRLIVYIDLKQAREVTGEQIFGVIGMDVLGTRRLQIDFDRGVVRFLESLDGTTEGLGEKMPLVFTERGLPSLSASLGDGLAESFLIDTGAQVAP